MIRNPIDVAVYVSPQLSAFIERHANDPDVEQPVTLAQVRDYLASLLSDSFKEAEHLHRFDVSDSILDELDALIEEFGASALAVEFSQARASEPLSRVIEAVVNDENRENPPTLGEVQEAMASGLVTSLVGEGVLEEDEDDALGAEIDALIGRFGDDALAEEFLRYE
jgi:hypothetical protein